MSPVRFAALAIAAVLATAACSSAEPAEGTSPVLQPTGSETTEPSANAAPEFPPGLDWLNVDRPLSLAELRGKVVLLDFFPRRDGMPGLIRWPHISVNTMERVGSATIA